MLDQGKKLYESGQFSQAVIAWQQALQSFNVQKDVLNQAMLLSDLSMAYQELGQWDQASEASASSLNLLETKPEVNSKERLRILAQAMNTHGSLQLAMGQAQQALATWEQATATYKRAGALSGVVGSLLNQAQALQSLGLYLKAKDTLMKIQQSLLSQPDSVLKAEALRSLGKTLRVVGDLKQSRQILSQSLAMAQGIQSPLDITAALLSLGNTARLQQDNQAALKFFEQATDAPASPIMHTQAQLNQLSLLLETKSMSEAKALLPQIQSQLASLSPSRASVYGRVNFAQSLTQLKLDGAEQTPAWLEIAQILVPAVQQAKILGDRRAQAYALGALGGLYEHTQQWAEAEGVTEQALILAQAVNAADIGYRLQWQLGRLLKSQGDVKGAIAAYTESVNELKSLRNTLVGVNPDIQFSFRDEVEPIYRQLVDLLLGTEVGSEPSQENLFQAREVIESLQLAELNNFFQFNCLEAKTVQIDQVVEQQDPTAAVIYPIILPDRLEVILKLPNLPLMHYKHTIAQSEVENIVQELRIRLTRPQTAKEIKPFSIHLYDWLIRPVEKQLATSQIKTLVFVLDGDLRNIPMSVLYDGKQYLIQKYAIALTPGLQLLAPQSLQHRHLKALAAGVSKAHFGFGALVNVEDELNQVKAEISGTKLLNNEFTITALQLQLNKSNFPVIHLASHGEFNSQADKTFILAWDQKIFVKDLSELLQNRDPSPGNVLELLVLSACQTAAGDKHAALGLAGVAARAGARSTLASLWSVEDKSTAFLMTHFYQNLATHHVSKAEALRLAQLDLLNSYEYQKAFYWTPYVLVGNWL